MNGNIDAFLLCFLESEACSISFYSLGSSLVELNSLFIIISAYVTEVLLIKKSSSIIIASTECKILAVMTTCHPCTISRCDSTIDSMNQAPLNHVLYNGKMVD